jgi:hypothetical protein
MMSFTLDWMTGARGVLHLVIEDTAHYADFVAIDAAITARLREAADSIVLIVDVSRALVNPYEIDRIRVTQTYLRSMVVAQIMVVDEKKVNRLAMLLLLNLGRPRLSFYDTVPQALSFANKGGHFVHSAG